MSAQHLAAQVLIQPLGMIRSDATRLAWFLVHQTGVDMKINGIMAAIAVCTLAVASHHARAAALVNAAGASVCLEVKGATIANQAVVQSNVCSDSFGQKRIFSNGKI